MTIEIGVIIATASFIMGFFTFNRNRDKDVKSDATESAIIRTKLDNIGQSVDSIRIFKASDQRWTALSETFIRIDESTKQAQKRTDQIEKKEMFNIENEVMHQVLIFTTILAPIVAAVVQVVKQTVTIPNNIYT